MVQTAQPVTPPVPKAPPVHTYDPETGVARVIDKDEVGQADLYKWDVDNNQLVEHRLTGLLDKNSDYTRQARAQAVQQAAGRGLLNSSMAAGAGQAAAISSGLPIAQQDASTYANAAQFNANAGNQHSQFNTQLRFNLGSQNAQLGQQMDMANLGAINDSRKYNTESANVYDRLMLELASREKIASAQSAAAGAQAAAAIRASELSANMQMLVNTNGIAGNLYSQYASDITNILNSSAYADQAAKDLAISNRKNLFYEGMDLIGSISGLNLRSIFD